MPHEGSRGWAGRQAGRQGTQEGMVGRYGGEQPEHNAGAPSVPYRRLGVVLRASTHHPHAPAFGRRVPFFVSPSRPTCSGCRRRAYSKPSQKANKQEIPKRPHEEEVQRSDSAIRRSASIQSSSVHPSPCHASPTQSIPCQPSPVPSSTIQSS